MYCTECGKEILDNAKFCSECGKLQTNAIKESQKEPISQSDNSQSKSINIGKTTLKKNIKNNLGYVYFAVAMGVSYPIVLLFHNLNIDSNSVSDDESNKAYGICASYHQIFFGSRGDDIKKQFLTMNHFEINDNVANKAYKDYAVGVLSNVPLSDYAFASTSQNQYILMARNECKKIGVNPL